MYPVLFRIGSFEVTSFGVLVAIAARVGIRLFRRELARSGVPQDAVNAAIGGVIGGLIGAKLVWPIEFTGQWRCVPNGTSMGVRGCQDRPEGMPCRSPKS